MLDPTTSIAAVGRRAWALAILALLTYILALAAIPAVAPAMDGTGPTVAMGGAPAPYAPPARGADSSAAAVVATLVLLSILGALSVVVSRIRRSKPAPPLLEQRWAGAAAVVGGALLIAFATLAAGEPRGCVGDECLARPHRDLGALDALLVIGGLMVICGYAGGADLVRRTRGQSTLLRAASVLLACGVGWAVIGAVIGGEWAWYAFAIPAMLTWVAGFAVAGVGVIRTGMAPAWLGASLIVTSAMLLGANDQDARVLLLIPFGATWILLGSVLVGGHNSARTKLDVELRRT